MEMVEQRIVTFNDNFLKNAFVKVIYKNEEKIGYTRCFSSYTFLGH
jgi:hypothetical protein